MRIKHKMIVFNRRTLAPSFGRLVVHDFDEEGTRGIGRLWVVDVAEFGVFCPLMIYKF